MSLLARTLFILAGLSLWSTATVAKEIKGAPKELIGTFSDSREQCLAYFEKGVEVDETTHIEREIPATHIYRWSEGKYSGYAYSTCSATQCSAAILSHIVTRDGFVLRLRYDRLHGSSNDNLSVTAIGNDRFKFKFSTGEPFTRVRCSRTPFHPDP